MNIKPGDNYVCLCEFAQGTTPIKEMLRVCNPGGALALRESDVKIWAIYLDSPPLLAFHILILARMASSGRSLNTVFATGHPILHLAKWGSFSPSVTFDQIGLIASKCTLQHPYIIPYPFGWPSANLLTALRLYILVNTHFRTDFSTTGFFTC